VYHLLLLLLLLNYLLLLRIKFPRLHVSPTPPPIELDFPHSILTSKIFPDSFPQSIQFFSSPSYSPVHSRPTSPADSTTSCVKFIDEVLIPPPRPRHYYYYDPINLDTLNLHFCSAPLPFLPSLILSDPMILI